MPLTCARAARGDGLQDVREQRVGTEALSQHRKPVAPDARAIVASEADDYERVVAKAERWTH
jgi:hypothetical protein